MNLAELGNLDPAKIGSWPLPIRLLIFLAICVLLLGAGFYFDTRNQMDQLAREESKEIDLRGEFETKQSKAANLEPFESPADPDETVAGRTAALAAKPH